MPETSISGFMGTEVAFLALFSLILLGISAQSTLKRCAGLVLLAATTVHLEKTIVPLCLANGRPHWAATAASLLWVQFLSASDLIIVRRIHAAQLQPKPRTATSSTTISRLVPAVKSAVGLLWNMRRVGTPWQVKNVPSTAGLAWKSRARFILGRLVVTFIAYLFVDIVVSLPPPESALLHPDKAALFNITLLRRLTIDDVIFRSATTIGYWLTTGILNLFMTNLGAIVAVSLGFSQPVDCPSLYGSFWEAYTVRRFWG